MVKQIAKRCLVALMVLSAVIGLPSSWAAEPAELPAPGQFIEKLGAELLARLSTDPKLVAGDSQAVRALVDEMVLPVLAFEQMTASTVGPAWRAASTAQRNALQYEFKLLLVRTYAGALKQLQGKKLVVFPVRMRPTDTEVTVRSEIQGLGSEPVPLAYRLSRDGASWVIYDINVVGIWLVETYRTQFAQQIQKSGVDGLIQALKRLNGNS
jgi:phospholipid transport system substrate-binding protein